VSSAATEQIKRYKNKRVIWKDPLAGHKHWIYLSIIGPGSTFKEAASEIENECKYAQCIHI
jgi:hypothetical protein